MSYKFNIFTNNFDLVGGGSAFWNDPVADKATLDAITTDTDGSVRVILSTNDAYRWNLGGSSWQFVGKVKTAAVGSTPNANGLSVGSDNTVTLQPADSTHPGVMTSGAQNIGGNKTFANNITVSGTTNADGGIDLSSAGTLTIGATNASTINIGNSGATVNIQGTTIYENTPQLLTADPLITVNHGGAAASGQNAGIQVEENSIITGYAETSSDRNSWILKAPNTAGVVTLTPGSSGITLDQSSHNPVTLTAVGSTPNANAASLSTQALTLQPADGTNPGLLTAGTQTIGGNKTFGGSITSNSVVIGGSANTISGLSTIVNSGTLTLPTSTDTLVGRATTDTLTNKTINGSNNTITNVSLTTGVTGILPVANGGTNSNSVLNNNRIMVSSGSSIVEASALTNGQLLIGSTGSAPVASSITGGSGITINTGTGSISVAMSIPPSAGDITETSFSPLNNQSVAANIGGLFLPNATVRSAKILLSVFVNATTPLYEVFDMLLIQKGSSWDISYSSVGDTSGFVFAVSNTGQVTYTNLNYTGFTAATMKFRVISTSV